MAEKKARENLAAHDDLNQPDDRKRAVYAALESKDTRFDGQIFAGVSSTDTYCRPVCKSNRHGGRTAHAESPTFTVRLGYRPPYRFADLLEFFRMRALAGVEAVDDVSYSRTVRLVDSDGAETVGWIRVEDDPEGNQLLLTLTDSLAPHVPEVIGRVRRMLDIDCDPALIAEGIGSLGEIVLGAVTQGTRLPGCFEPFETACRAVLGQQVSVQAANKLAARIVEAYGEEIDLDCPAPGLTHAWPTPIEVLALDHIEDAFGELGVIKTRTRTIVEIARMLACGELCLAFGTAPEEQMEGLLSIKGIGPWTANYIAMRVLNYPDAFLETDAGVAHALPGLLSKRTRSCSGELQALAELCRHLAMEFAFIIKGVA